MLVNDESLAAARPPGQQVCVRQSRPTTGATHSIGAIKIDSPVLASSGVTLALVAVGLASKQRPRRVYSRSPAASRAALRSVNSSTRTILRSRNV